VCDRWADGQSASLQAGVAALGEVEAAVVTLGDQPFISAEVIAGVLDHRGRHLAVRATYDGRPGHPVLLERRLLDHVIELDGDTGARPLLEGDHVYTWEVGRLCDPTDIDTPERLQEVQS
jgi:CTP:molybdopterin cytidylyltransferase MocA